MPGPEQNQPHQQHHPHDKGYKQLLANKRTFLELLRTFVREKWVDNIDENSLIRLDKSYVLQDFNEKEADIVYRLRSKDRDVIFYVLLELQSTVDFLMPLRLLMYMVEIWRDIYNNTPENERERKDFLLPVIIPAVLYNGANNWTAAVNFKEMLAGYRQFEKHVLDFQYILFDVNRYHKEELYRAANLIASVFALDQRMDAGELITRLQKLADGLKNLSRDEFRQFIIWLGNVLKAKLPETLREEVSGIINETNPWEVETMIMNLEITLDELEQQAMIKGKMEGKIEGKMEGKIEGKMETARIALKKGLPEDLVAEITALDMETVRKLKGELN